MYPTATASIFNLCFRCPFNIPFGGSLARADGNRSSVSSEGFCENDTEGELLPMPINLPMVLATGRGSNSSSSSGNNSSSSSNSGDRNHLRTGARPKEFAPTSSGEASGWSKDVKDIEIDNINCFGFDEVEHAFLEASRSGSCFPKETKQNSSIDIEDDEDVGLFDVACSSRSTESKDKKPSSCRAPEGLLNKSAKGNEEAAAAAVPEVAETSNPTNDSGTAEEGACGPAPPSTSEADPERRPSKDDSISSSTSDSYHLSGDDYTVYYFDPKASGSGEAEKTATQENDSEKKEDKPSSSIDKLLENVKKETDPWENLFARYFHLIHPL